MSLLSLVPPSCMVAPIRKLANTLILSLSNLQSTQLTLSIPQQMNIEINKTKSMSKMFSLNSSRESSVHSDTSSIDYVERVQAMANNSM